MTELEKETEKLSLNKQEKTLENDSKERPSTERTLNFGFASLKGKRDRNEDAHLAITSLPNDPGTALFAVFDGHGGKGASNYCKLKMSKNITLRKCYKEDKKKAITKGFLRTDERYLSKMKNDGCTAIVALLTDDNKLYVGNAGDSRGILSQGDKVIELSKDHKPNDDLERKRIEAAGHEVVKETILVNGKREQMYRVDGTTAVSRSIGDGDFKDAFSLPPEQQAITSYPDITEFTLEKGQFFVLACDGIFDVYKNEEVIAFVKSAMESEKDLNKVANALGESAIERGSEDNITAVIVSLE